MKRLAQRLKIHFLIAVTVGCDCKQQIAALGNVGAAIIEEAIAERFLYGEGVGMGMQAAEGRGEAPEVIFERLRHVVVELLIAGRGVHDKKRALCGVSSGDLFREETEVGHGMRVVILDGVCVEADEADIGSLEREVLLAEQLGENLVAIAEDIVVADQADVGYAKLVQPLYRPLELFGHSELGVVSAMYHEVNVIAPVGLFHEGLRLVVSPLRVTDEEKTQRVFPLASGLDAGDLRSVDLFGQVAVDPPVIRMIIDEVAAGQQPAEK